MSPADYTGRVTTLRSTVMHRAISGQAGTGSRTAARGIRLAGTWALVALLCGCAGSAAPFGAATPAYDARFGESVRQALKAQTLDPDASTRNLGKTTQMDGTAAKNSVDRYQDSFKEPPPPVTVINVGGR